MVGSHWGRRFAILKDLTTQNFLFFSCTSNCDFFHSTRTPKYLLCTNHKGQKSSAVDEEKDSNMDSHVGKLHKLSPLFLHEEEMK